MVINPAKPTIAYVEGFNFYYGALKRTQFKWIDLAALFEVCLGPQHDLLAVKYFTARVKPTPNNPDVHIRQGAYLRALKAHCPKVEIFFGHFLRHSVFMESVSPPPPRSEVWKNEEKGSDVNLALHVLNGAWRNACECALVVSNDSDLAESLRMVKVQHKKVIGLITPADPVGPLQRSWPLMQISS